MYRSGLAILFAVLLAIMAAGPVTAQDSPLEKQEGGRPGQSIDEETPTVSEEDEPQIDLLEYGAWGVASRDFEQSGEDLEFAFIFSASIAAFPDEETAEDAFPQVVEAMLELEQNQDLEEVDVDDVADEQIFLYGEIESNGITFNLGMLVVRNGEYLTLAGGLSYETLDLRDDLVALSTFLQGQIEDATPETGDDLGDMLPEPDDLPRADEIDDPYVIRDERIRTAD